MSVVAVEEVEIPAPHAPIRAVLARPRVLRGALPVVVAWPDVFQLTAPHLRLVCRLAGHGFAVLAPELYARLEPPRTVFHFDRDRERALGDAARVEVAWIDEEWEATRAFLGRRAGLDAGRLGVWGFCFGGHVAFRAALAPEVRAAVCAYPTGLHTGSVGAAVGTADTLARAGELRGRLLLVWGTGDPHIPAPGRHAIHRALDEAGVSYEARLYEAEHTFMRDEGARFDPDAADRAFAATVEHFRRVFEVPLG